MLTARQTGAAMLGINDTNRKWWILIAASTVGGLILLDETVVGIALPTIRQDLGMGETAAHWVISAYFLVLTAFAAAFGKIGDIVGFHVLLYIGAVLFAGASLAAGFADDGTVLIAARVVEGLGAAIIFPGTIAMITIAFPPDQRGMAIGIMAAIGTTFLAVGPLVGGFFTEIISWRWIFWINVPIVAAIVLVIALAWVAPPRKAETSRFDYGGLVTLIASTTLIVFAVMQGGSWGWGNATILTCLIVGVAVLIAFVIIENRRDAPLLEVDLFRIGEFSACTLVLFVGQYAKIVIVIFGALYLQQSLGMSPLTAGFALLAAVAGFPFLSAPVGRFADKHGARKPVLLGLGVATLAMAWIVVAIVWNSYLLLLPGLLIWGLAMPFCYSPTLRAMANAVPPEKQGQTSGIGITSRLVGGTVSMAISSTLLVATGSYQLVFLVAAVVMAAAWIAGWRAIAEETAA